jgi:hypothetical protein
MLTVALRVGMGTTPQESTRSTTAMAATITTPEDNPELEDDIDMNVMRILRGTLEATAATVEILRGITSHCQWRTTVGTSTHTGGQHRGILVLMLVMEGGMVVEDAFSGEARRA